MRRKSLLSGPSRASETIIPSPLAMIWAKTLSWTSWRYFSNCLPRGIPATARTASSSSPRSLRRMTTLSMRRMEVAAEAIRSRLFCTSPAVVFIAWDTS